jgi:DNA (cytosine-5)-methyltransferase 1
VDANPGIAVRNPIVRAILGDEMIVDSFAGGGGASTGIELALGRSPDIAVNHDPEAIAMHRENHPTTEHHIDSVWNVDPRVACRGKPVALAWFSPDCKHHSKAKGGKPREQKIRGLAWVAVTWAARVRPRVIILENVEEFRDWGPLDSATGQPIKARRGQTFRAFLRKLERLGYVVEHRLLRACDFGAPTTRRRLFLIARCDGHPIVWPAPTHGPVATRGQLELGQRAVQPYRTAAEVIDWSIPCPSIFDRERPLADKTMARIARGIRKFVLEAARPFVVKTKTYGGGGNDAMSITASKRGEFALVTPTIVRTAHGDVDRNGKRRGIGAHAVEAPLPTVCASGTDFAVAVPYLVHRSNGERPGQAPRIYDAERPLGTIVAQGQKHALCTAFLAKHYSDRSTGGWGGGAAADRPIDTITTRDHHAVVAAHVTKLYGTSTGADARDPLPTITSGGEHLGAVAAHLIRYNGDRSGAERVADLEEPLGTQTTANRYALVAAFLARYNGQSTGQQPDAPLGTLDTTDRYALVTVTIDGEEYAIVDIGMRMLTPRELFRAQGFPDDYRIEIEHRDKRLSKTAQVRMVGNSVSPPAAAAIVGANLASDMVDGAQ